MDLNDASGCYRVLQSRDARFDGRLFVGVTSTGIYCRPVCPARTPRFENCRFYPSAAAAQQQGFRPCLRCRPETAPGGGAWRGSSDTVARALALLAAEGNDERRLADVAARLHVSGRQLRRLFQQHLGASPVAVLQTRRVLLAKQLIHETRLPMTAVAMAAGFGSLRRFNETFKALYGRPPGALRRDAGPAAPGGEIVVRLRYRPPYDWAALLDGCAPVPGIALISQQGYARTVTVGGVPGTVRVSHDAARQSLDVGIRLADVRALPALLEQVARRFDTHADIATIEAHLSADPLLAPRIAARPGLRPDTPWDCFESAVLALLPPADLDAFLHRYATPLPDALRLPGLTRLFPPPATVAAAQPAALRRLAAAAMEATGDEPPSTFADPVLALRAAAWQPWVAYAVRHLAHRSDSSPD